MMEQEMSKTLKRRLRRERVAQEKVGDYIAFTPRSVPIAAKSDDAPKLTNSAKRAARKRKKEAAWKQEAEDICSGKSSKPAVELKEKLEHDKPKKKKKNKKRKLNKDISNDNGASSAGTEVTEGSGVTVDGNVVDETTENNDQTTGEEDKPNGLGLPKEPKKDLPPKKRRYVLFVGNLAYDTTEEDVRQHFHKVGAIISVRIARHQDSDRGRGFCHLEVGDEETYLKALSLHHTFMAKRRINVEYSSGQSEEKKGEVKRKNFKLQTLNKTGRLFHQHNQGGNKVKTKPAEKVRGGFFV